MVLHEQVEEEEEGGPPFERVSAPDTSGNDAAKEPRGTSEEPCMKREGQVSGCRRVDGVEVADGDGARLTSMDMRAQHRQCECQIVYPSPRCT